jgi:hypothetical protein
MKLFATSGTWLSFGLCAAASLAQTHEARTEPTYLNAPLNAQSRLLPGRRYEAVSTAYKLKLQPAAAQNNPEQEIPSPSDNVPQPDAEVIGGSPSILTPAPAEATHGNGLESSGAYCADDCGAEWSDRLVYESGRGCWFGGIYGLLMAREDDVGDVLSFDAVGPAACLLDSDAGFSDYAGGLGANVGRYIGDCYALEAGYWGIYPDVHEANVFGIDTIGGLNTALGFEGMEYNNGTVTLPLQDFFGNTNQSAIRHRLQRSYEVHNVELNLIRSPHRRNGCTNYELFAGARYFKFNDGLLFSADTLNDVFGDDPNNELHYGIDVDNHLVGFQIGGRVDHQVLSNLSVNAGAKLGIYNNRIDHEQSIQGGNGFAVNSTTGAVYDIRGTDDEVAFLGELFAGVSYDINCNWRVFGGYQAVSITGVATAAGQIPRDCNFFLLCDDGDVDDNESLLLHGAYLGAEYSW